MGLFDKFKKKPKQETTEFQLPPGVKLPPNVRIVQGGSSQNLSNTDLRKTALLNLQLAAKYEEDKDYTHASRYFLHAVENIRSKAEKGRDVTDLTILYQAYVHLGGVYREMGNKSEAGKYWELGFEVNNTLISVEPKESSHYLAAGISGTWAGFNYRESDNRKKAAQCYQACLEIIRKAENMYNQLLVHSFPEGRRLGSFHAECCLNLAELADSESDAQRLSDECIRTMINLYELDTNEDRLYELANAVYLCALTIKGDKRKQRLQDAYNMCEGMLEDAQNRIRFVRLQKQIMQAK